MLNDFPKIVELRNDANLGGRGLESNCLTPKSPLFLHSRLPLVSRPLCLIPSDASVDLVSFLSGWQCLLLGNAAPHSPGTTLKILSILI